MKYQVRAESYLQPGHIAGYIPDSMLLARDSIVDIIIPSSISLPASLFIRSVMHHPVTNSLVTLLARLIVMCITERAWSYLSDTRSDKS